MQSPTVHNWKDLIRTMRKKFPTSVPVYVRRLKMVKHHGRTYPHDDKYIIHINSNQDADAQKDALLHEWAHAVAIDEACQHKNRWGEIYSQIYEVWETWDNKD